ncbi:BspA family leucine-rich repeat surface protein [Sediminitomix flava]|uniref:Putative repeat protein (TIGR02543 family)/predicted secreted protein (Por secretion system target) n=1 Tax=Sediminitomix flava TaxID=379075 RepID=A0A315ZAW4_SEDFL|nr:BspA family leucine-rich repeat surface protein [Sediminitomix flava]PWJ42193.1 putative repeat protein (TIGR02543 family)/predicted secreted protein (Por secretion system target) [Sediminitomix flava]
MKNFYLTSSLSLSLFFSLLFTSNLWAQDRPFIVTVEIPENSKDFYIKIAGETNGSGASDYTIDWGDGIVSAGGSMTERHESHIYAAPGTYTVSVSGFMPNLTFMKFQYASPNSNEAKNAAKVKTLEQWGDNTWYSTGFMLGHTKNMVCNYTDSPDLSNVISMIWMFGFSAFNGTVVDWDVSNVEDLSFVFHETRSFNGDLSSWDVSNVTNMSWIFYGAESFNGDLSSWDVSSVVYMISMFYRANSFEGDLSTWDVSSATDMSSMFYNVNNFTSDLSSWDVSSVTDMSSMFYNVNNFTSDLSSWDVSSVTNMSSMFYNVNNFTSDLSSWDVSSVTNMSSMFYNVNNFTSDLSSWDVSSVTDMSSMFYNVNNFTSDLSSWNVSSVTDMSSMFYEVNLGFINYEKLLIAWAEQDVVHNVNFWGGNNFCNQKSIAARQKLIIEKGWSISDKGIKCPGPVSFNALGGTPNIIDDQTPNDDHQVVPPSEAPTKDGLYAKWYTSEDEGVTFGDAWDFNDVVISEMTLYAQYYEGGTITYELSGGENNPKNPLAYTVHDEIVFSTPSKLGYSFLGWYDNADFEGEPIETVELGSRGNVSLWAQWEIEEYTITYSLNGGDNSASNPSIYTVLDEVTLEEPTKLGYAFLGWYDNQYFTGEPLTDLIGIARDINLWAKWEFGVKPQGEGTEANPYQISNLGELRWLSVGLENGLTEEERWQGDNAFYVLTANIDATETAEWRNGKGFAPIGSYFSYLFDGSFDGQGYTISNLYISNESENDQGLFGGIFGAEIKNLRLENLQIKGNDAVGAIGYAAQSTITGIHVSGTIEGNERVGGIVGSLTNTTIGQSSSDVEITASKEVGGLVGYATTVFGAGGLDAKINYSFAVGEINGTSHLGGILGYGATSVEISNTFSTLDISGASEVGGIAGENNGGYTEKSYAIGAISASGSSVGGVIGVNSTGLWVEKSYWDKETTGVTTSAGLNDSNGLKTSEFNQQNKFSSWDFTNDWVITKLRYDEAPRPYFRWQTIEVTATTDGNGVIEGDALFVEVGSSPIFTVVPNEGYNVSTVTVDEQEITLDDNSSFTIEEVTEAATIHATFELKTFDITVTQADNGVISPSTATVDYDSSQVFTITPNEGYEITDVQVDGESVGIVSEYTFENVSEEHTITASYALKTFDITVTQGENGMISPSTTTVNYGSNQTFVITADDNYEIADVLVDGESVGLVSEYTFENVTEVHAITASFIIKSFKISVLQSEGGEISPESTIVNYGKELSFTITPDYGYNIANVYVDGEGVGAIESYTFENVTEEHEIRAEFSRITSVEIELGEISFYPNPSSHWIELSGIETNSNLLIVNSIGVSVASYNIKTSKQKISIVELPTGVYFLKLDGKLIGKLVKE